MVVFRVLHKQLKCILQCVFYPIVYQQSNFSCQKYQNLELENSCCTIPRLLHIFSELKRLVYEQPKAITIHATGTGNAGGKGFLGLLPVPAAKADRQNRQKKMRNLLSISPKRTIFLTFFPPINPNFTKNQQK